MVFKRLKGIQGNTDYQRKQQRCWGLIGYLPQNRKEFQVLMGFLVEAQSLKDFQHNTAPREPWQDTCGALHNHHPQRIQQSIERL